MILELLAVEILWRIISHKIKFHLKNPQFIAFYTKQTKTHSELI